MPKSLRSFVVSLRNDILSRRPLRPTPPSHDADRDLSLTGTVDQHDPCHDKNASSTPPPPLSQNHGPVSNVKLSPTTCHPESKANDTTAAPRTARSQGPGASTIQGTHSQGHLASDMLFGYQRPSLASIAQIAYDRRARRAAVKEEVERRVHLCEEHLQVLRQELSEAERELQEVESNVQAWRKIFAEGVAARYDDSCTQSGFVGFPDNISNSSSDASS